jgi:hypothetical protein
MNFFSQEATAVAARCNPAGWVPGGIASARVRIESDVIALIEGLEEARERSGSRMSRLLLKFGGDPGFVQAAA